MVTSTVTVDELVEAPSDASSVEVESPELEQPASAKTAQQAREISVIRIKESTFGTDRRSTALRRSAARPIDSIY
jgi:hypothetical protein